MVNDQEYQYTGGFLLKPYFSGVVPDLVRLMEHQHDIRHSNIGVKQNTLCKSCLISLSLSLTLS